MSFSVKVVENCFKIWTENVNMKNEIIYDRKVQKYISLIKKSLQFIEKQANESA